MSDSLVSVRDVTKTFHQRGRRVQALEHVDLDIRRDEFVSLLGPSGCGKSTLLRIIGGLHESSTGTVTVNGLDADTARAAKQYGLVPQSLRWRRGGPLPRTFASSPGCTGGPPPTR